MGETVKLTYSEMRDNCTRLKTCADEYASTAKEVTSLVGSFTGAWEGTAEATFEEDFNVLSNAMTTATDTMLEIINLVESYVSSMEEVENAYGKSHVTVG